MPGLAEMHGHLWSAGDDPRKAEHRLLQWMASGITTVRAMDHLEPTEGPHNNAKLRLALRQRIAAGGLLTPWLYVGVRYRGSDNPADIVARMAEFKAAGYDFLKIRSESLASVTAMTTAARQVGLPVAAHFPQEATFEQALAMGVRSWEHFHTRLAASLLGPLGAIADRLEDSIRAAASDEAQLRSLVAGLLDTARARPRIEAMRRANVWVSPTYMIQSRVVKKRRLHVRLEQLLKMLSDAGLLLLGSDRGTEAIHDELQQLVDGGLTPYEALVAGTRNVAAYFGTLAETGTVAVGKRADLVLLTGDPLADIRNAMKPTGVMVGGRWLTQDEIQRRIAVLEAAADPGIIPSR